jgi:glycine/D-amino acid oxidase-like deaminating enzyme
MPFRDAKVYWLKLRTAEICSPSSGSAIPRTRMPREFENDVVVVGGAGHVGLPLAIALAHRGASVVIYDLSERAVDLINSGVVPFLEPGAEPMLRGALAAGRIRATVKEAVERRPGSGDVGAERSELAELTRQR